MFKISFKKLLIFFFIIVILSLITLFSLYLLSEKKYYSYNELIELYTISQNCQDKTLKKKLSEKYSLFKYKNQLKYYDSLLNHTYFSDKWNQFLEDSIDFFLKEIKRKIDIKYFYKEAYKKNYNKFNTNYLIAETILEKEKTIKIDLPPEYYKVYFTNIYNYSFIPDEAEKTEIILVIEYYRNNNIQDKTTFNEAGQIIKNEIYNHQKKKKISHYYHNTVSAFTKEEDL